MLQVIHREAFDRVCEVLNKVHQARRTDWDLHILAVRWAYKTMCKTPTAEMIPEGRNRVEAVIYEENAKRSPPVSAPVVVTLREDQDEEITQLHKVKHIKVQKAIR